MKEALHAEPAKVVSISKYTYAAGAVAGVFCGSFKHIKSAVVPAKVAVISKPAVSEPKPKTSTAVA